MAIVIEPGVLISGAISAAAAIAGFLTGARKVARPVLEMATEWRQFRGDWYGVDSRPGFPGHPGMAARVEAIEGELKANGGGSLRDAVRRIEAQQRLTAQHSGAPVIVERDPVPNHTYAEGT